MDNLVKNYSPTVLVLMGIGLSVSTIADYVGAEYEAVHSLLIVIVLTIVTKRV